MGLGMAPATAAAVLDAIFNNVSYAVPAVWLKLHLGDPGVAGALNAATETSRKQVSCAAAAASSGTVATDADLTWVAIAGSEDATHYSLWTASTAGTFLGSGTITADAYTAGGVFTIPSGQLIHEFEVAT